MLYQSGISINSLVLRKIKRIHIQRPRGEKEGVSSRRSTKFRERLEVEEFALGEDETPSKPTDCKFERTNRHTEKAGLNLIHYDRL